MCQNLSAWQTKLFVRLSLVIAVHGALGAWNSSKYCSGEYASVLYVYNCGLVCIPFLSNSVAALWHTLHRRLWLCCIRATRIEPRRLQEPTLLVNTMFEVFGDIWITSENLTFEPCSHPSFPQFSTFRTWGIWHDDITVVTCHNAGRLDRTFSSRIFCAHLQHLHACISSSPEFDTEAFFSTLRSLSKHWASLLIENSKFNPRRWFLVTGPTTFRTYWFVRVFFAHSVKGYKLQKPCCSSGWTFANCAVTCCDYIIRDLSSCSRCLHPCVQSAVLLYTYQCSVAVPHGNDLQCCCNVRCSANW